MNWMHPRQTLARPSLDLPPWNPWHGVWPNCAENYTVACLVILVWDQSPLGWDEEGGKVGVGHDKLNDKLPYTHRKKYVAMLLWRYVYGAVVMSLSEHAITQSWFVPKQPTSYWLN